MTLLNSLPPYQGKRFLVKNNHDVYDIVNEVCAAHGLFSSDYDLIAPAFWKGNVYSTALYLFDFCKSNFIYRIEPGAYQTTRSPAAIIQTSKKIGVDCKHYAGFIAGVLDALRRSGKKISWFYRFASYEQGNKRPEHVFVVVMDAGRELFIDPVLSYLNCRYPQYFYKLDKKIAMPLERISGLSGSEYDPLTGELLIPGTPEYERNEQNKLKEIQTLGTTLKTNYLFWIAGGLLAFYLYKNFKTSRRGK